MDPAPLPTATVVVPVIVDGASDDVTYAVGLVVFLLAALVVLTTVLVVRTRLS